MYFTRQGCSSEAPAGQDEARAISGLFVWPCIVSRMDKKEIKSPKLTANFLLWTGLFLLAMFLLIAHFVWRLF